MLRPRNRDGRLSVDEELAKLEGRIDRAENDIKECRDLILDILRGNK